MHSPFPADQEAQSLHVARSRFLDAYGSVEAAICKRLKAHGIEPGHRSVGQKIEALRDIKASPQYSKSERQRIHQVLDRLERTNEIRCDVVHAALKVIDIEGELSACFINSRHLGGPTTIARHIDRQQFETLIRDITTIAAELSA
jgi:hypothetical protein